ncbi:hypothetical protein [Mycolicibacterium hodleri]|uniref:Phosphodiester glycosidase domain-containing protein n=1 Tax=Mycolicibacterium hodleri TaxID=49897 RepID=A0A502E836_9MYCO|nr:hypothetical protein [Mycolicibacterium hodleri]TPG33042.1 hypothetical protein EAH80_16685 [Mycolicibacterium hodleri]
MATVVERDDPLRPANCRGRRPPRRRQWLRIGLAIVTVAAVVIVGCVIDALRVPGPDSVAAKLAEWGRSNGFNSEVTWLEKELYLRNQPAIGGQPTGGIPAVAGTVPQAVSSSTLPSEPLTPLGATSPLPGEGRWQTVVSVRGKPAVQVASLRPDGQHTSFVVGVLRMDPALITGELRPGTTDPGGTWRASSSLTSSDMRSIAVAFNGGFRLTDPSQPGYYSQGRTVARLIDGEASLVLRADGVANVGRWNQEVRMAPDVVSVRQNLVPLVDGGELNQTCATGGTKEWGTTIGQTAFIHRSGFGVTASGVEVYVAGPALSVCTLGRVLQDAGVVRGMELDINPDWVSGAYFHAHVSGTPQSFRLFPDEKVSPRHYLGPSSRDWFAWFTR